MFVHPQQIFVSFDPISSMLPPITNPSALDLEQRYRMLIESIKDYAICMLATDGTVITWNPGAQQFKGYMPEEIIGRHFSEFYTDEDRATGLPMRALQTAIEGLRLASIKMM